MPKGHRNQHERASTGQMDRFEHQKDMNNFSFIKKNRKRALIKVTLKINIWEEEGRRGDSTLY